jgi:hypothetical protein
VALSSVCHELRNEFNTSYETTSLAYANLIIVHDSNFSNADDAILSLRRIPSAAKGVERKIVFHSTLRNEVCQNDIMAFVKALPLEFSSESDSAMVEHSISFDLSSNFNLDAARLTFARLAKRYRFHKPDAEQRAWEKLYWAFAEAAEEVDGVTGKQYTLGCWMKGGRGLCFV